MKRTPTSREPLVRCLGGDVGGCVVERLEGEPTQTVSVALRSAAPHVHLSAGRFAQASSKRIVLAKWVISGKAMIGEQGRRLVFGPGEIGIHLPASPHAFWVIEEGTEMCWFSLNGALAEQFVMGVGLRPGVYAYGSPPEAEILALAAALRDQSIQGRRRASLMAIALIYDIANRVRVSTEEIPSVVRQAQRIIHENFADAELSTAHIARQVNYHRGALSRLFHQSTGVTLIDYLTQIRLQEARMLLIQTSDKMSEIARKCGIGGPVYFSRWIRKHTGMTPEGVRKSALS